MSEQATPSATLAEGFQAVVAAELDALLHHRGAARAGDIEGVHQMRVALRRLRACLVLFGPHLRRRDAAGFNEELRALGRVLGEARDWDVFCAETLPAAGDGAELLGPPAELERAAAHRRLGEVLAGPAPQALASRLTAWSRAALPAVVAGRGFADEAPALLDRLARKLRRRSRHVGKLDSEDLHDLRKALKKLRYAADFTSRLFEPAAVRRYEKRCKRLQELLGAINDAAAARSLGERLVGSGGELAAPVERFQAWAERRGAEARPHLAKACRALAETAPFWAG